jgi:hypothetical protein
MGYLNAVQCVNKVTKNGTLPQESEVVCQYHPSDIFIIDGLRHVRWMGRNYINAYHHKN